MGEGLNMEFSVDEQLEQNTRSLTECIESFNKMEDETASRFDKVMDMLRELSNDIRTLISPSEYESEFPMMNRHPDSTIGDVQQVEEQQVEAFISTTPFEDISVVGKEIVTGRNGCNVLDKLTESFPVEEQVYEPYAHHMFDETPKLFLVNSDGEIYGKSSSSKIEGLEIDHHMFDGMPELTSAMQNKRLDVHGQMVLPIGGLPRALRYESGVNEVSSFIISSKSKFEEKFMFVDIKNNEFDADCWVNGILMFIFDPGGSFSSQIGCDILKVVIGSETNEETRENFIKIDTMLLRNGEVGGFVEVEDDTFLERPLYDRNVHPPPKDPCETVVGWVLHVTCRTIVQLDLDDVKLVRMMLCYGSWFEEMRGLVAPLSTNNNVPPSLTSVTMVYYCSIVEVGCRLFDPGGGYLPTNDQSSMPKNMCVCIVEWCSNDAFALVDFLSGIQRALDSDDVELVRMKFCDVLNTIQLGIVPKLVDVPSDSVINPVITSLPTYQDFRKIVDLYVAADEIELLTCKAFDIKIVGNELCKPSPLCGMSSVKKILNQFMLYMSWIALIFAKTGDERAAEMFMLNGVNWNLQYEQGWSAWREALCAKDEVQLVATTKDMSVVSSSTTLYCLAETFGQLKILKSFPKLWMEMKEEGNLLPVLNQNFLGQKSSFKPDKDVKKNYQLCPQFLDNLSDKKGEPAILIAELKHPIDNNRIRWINIVHKLKKVKPLQQALGWMLGAYFVMLEGMVSWAQTIDEKGGSDKWLQEFEHEISFVMEGATGLMTNLVPHKMESTNCLIIVSVKQIIWSSGLYVCYFLILEGKDACEREEVIENVQNVYINMELYELLNRVVSRGRRCVDPTARSINNIQMLNAMAVVIFMIGWYPMAIVSMSEMILCCKWNNVFVLQVEQCAEGIVEVLLVITNGQHIGFIANFQRAPTLIHTLTLSYKLGEDALIIQCVVEMVDLSFIIAAENFVWDPGLIWVYVRFFTLRTRWLLRGRICHESSLKLKKIIIGLLTVGTVSNGDVIQLPFYVSDVVMLVVSV